MDNGASSYRRFREEGDDTGLVEVIREYKDGLTFFIYSIVGDLLVAEDLVEDTFVLLGTKKPKDKQKGSFKTFRRINEYEKDRINRKRKTRRVAVIIAAEMILLFFSFSIAFPVYARELPLVGNVFAYIQDHLDIFGLYSSYANEVGETTENAGVKITLSEVYCDGEDLFISYLIESNRIADMMKQGDYTDKQLLCESKIYYTKDGQKIFLNENGIAGIEGRFVEENVFAGVESYCMNMEGYPDEFKLNISMVLCQDLAQNKMRSSAS